MILVHHLTSSLQLDLGRSQGEKMRLGERVAIGWLTALGSGTVHVWVGVPEALKWPTANQWRQKLSLDHGGEPGSPIKGQFSLRIRLRSAFPVPNPAAV